MNRLQRFLKALGFGYQASATPTNYPYFGNSFELWNQFWTTRDSRIDFGKEVGDLRQSSLIVAIYTWIARNTASARLEVVSLDSDNKEKEIPDHPLTDLFYQPNPYYGFEELIAGVSFSWLTAATAYILRVNGDGGQPVQLWYEPHWSIRPTWPTDGSAWISGYEVERNGKWYPISIDDVIVFRDGIDMASRCGQSRISAVIKELYTEQQAAQFTGLLLRNGLVPPVVVGLGSKENPFTGDPAEIAAQLKRKMSSSDSVGEPAVVPGDVTVQRLGFDYSSVGLRDVRQVPEERLCAALGISPYSLHFGTSRTASTFSNVEQYLKYDYKSYIVPFQKYIAGVLTRSVLPAFDSDQSHKVCWNYDEVELMQADLSSEWDRVAAAYKARIIDQAEARDAIGYKFDDSHKGIYYPVPNTTVTFQPIPEPGQTAVAPQQQAFADMPAKPADGQAAMAQAKALGAATGADVDKAIEWWQQNAPADAKGLLR